jgi:ribosome-binding protein aMBF1 (putative translation factor)
MTETATTRVLLGVLADGLVRVDPHKGQAYSTRYKPDHPLGVVNSEGYIVCTLHYRGERAQIKVHQLVWVSANGPIPFGMVPDHKNRKRGDNRISNLKLVTHKGNAENRRTYAGSENPAAKINQAIADRIRAEWDSGLSYSKLALKYAISKSLVAAICRGELWNNRPKTQPQR